MNLKHIQFLRRLVVSNNHYYLGSLSRAQALNQKSAEDNPTRSPNPFVEFSFRTFVIRIIAFVPSVLKAKIYI